MANTTLSHPSILRTKSSFLLFLFNSNQVRSPILQCISRLDEKRPNHPNPTDKNNTPQICGGLTCVVDVNDVVDNSRDQVTSSEGVESLSRKTSQISSDNSGSEESEVLKAVSLSAFTADDAIFGCLVDGLVCLEGFHIGSRRAVVEDLGLRGCICMGKEGQ